MRLIIGGLLLCLAGFAHAVVLVNIPYQDTAPDVIARRATHETNATNVMTTGFILSVAGIAVMIVNRLRRSK